VTVIHEAGGIASFAHPGVTKRDELVAPLAEHGLDAIEVYHSDHTVEDTAAYKRMAARLGILVSGGSDFHGEDPASAKATVGRPGKPGRAQRAIFGAVVLPQADFEALESKIR
jgi:predicted metal-dependent phosphoesterase TrpH